MWVILINSLMCYHITIPSVSQSGLIFLMCHKDKLCAPEFGGTVTRRLGERKRERGSEIIRPCAPLCPCDLLQTKVTLSLKAGIHHTPLLLQCVMMCKLLTPIFSVFPVSEGQVRDLECNRGRRYAIIVVFSPCQVPLQNSFVSQQTLY